MSEWMVKILANALDLAALAILTEKVLEIPFHFSLQKGTGYLLLFSSAFVISSQWNAVSFVYLFVMFFLLIHYVYKKKLLESFYINMAVFATACILLYIIVFLLGLLFKILPSENINTDLCAEIIYFLLCIAVCNFAPIQKILYLLRKKNLWVTSCLVLLNVINILFVTGLGIDLSIVDHFLFYIILIVLFSVVFILSIYISEIKIEQKDRELERDNRYIEEIQTAMDRIQARQHEYKNHINTILSLAGSTEDTAEFKESVSKYFHISLDEIELNMSKIIMMDNKEASALLSSKIMQGEKKKLSIKYNIQNPKTSKYIDNYDLNEILGCLLDNAIEATAEENRIMISLFENDNRFIIEVCNEHESLENEMLEKVFAKGYSTKEKNTDRIRGYGLYNVSRIVKKHHGECDAFNEIFYDSEFVVFRITLPLREKANVWDNQVLQK